MIGSPARSPVAYAVLAESDWPAPRTRAEPGPRRRPESGGPAAPVRTPRALAAGPELRRSAHRPGGGAAPAPSRTREHALTRRSTAAGPADRLTGPQRLGYSAVLPNSSLAACLGSGRPGLGVYYSVRRIGGTGKDVPECQESSVSLGLIGSSSRALTAMSRRTSTWSARAAPASSGSNRSSWLGATVSVPTN